MTSRILKQVKVIRVKNPKQKESLSKHLETCLIVRSIIFELLSYLSEKYQLNCWFSKYKVEKLFSRKKIQLIDDELIQVYESDQELIDWVRNEIKIVPQMFVYGFVHQWVNAFKSVIEKRKKGEKASMPSCRRSNTVTIQVDGMNLKIWNDYIHVRFFGNWYQWKLPKDIDPNSISSVLLIYLEHLNEIELHVRYITEIRNLQPDPKNWLSLDLGVKNLFSGVSNVGPSIILDSGGILSFLHWCYSKIGLVQSKKIKTLEKRIRAYYQRRIRTLLHQISSKILEYCIAHNIGTVIVGENIINSVRDTAKNKKLSKRLRVILRRLPFGKFINMLQTKLKKFGIQLVRQDESYTSKTHSFYDEPEKQEEYSCKRIYRGLVRDQEGNIFNSDLNAALNIAKKSKYISSTEILSNIHIWKQKISNSVKLTLGKFLQYSWCNPMGSQWLFDCLNCSTCHNL